MKKYFIFILLLLTIKIAHAQECSSCFIDCITSIWQKQSKKFDKKTFHTLDKSLWDNIDIIHIPEMFVTKEGEKLFSKREASKENLICYLNTKKILFNESYIYSDTTIVGALLDQYELGLKYVDNKNIYTSISLPLMIKMKEISPDFIFHIYNLPECYWYIKNDQLYVLSYKHTETGIKDIDTMKANEYIRNYLNEEDLVFLSSRPIYVSF